MALSYILEIGSWTSLVSGCNLWLVGEAAAESVGNKGLSGSAYRGTQGKIPHL